MIPETDALQAIALAGQGQNVSEIARHLGHERKTIRIYLKGHRASGLPRPCSARSASQGSRAPPVTRPPPPSPHTHCLTL